jgi:hypothetical protein
MVTLPPKFLFPLPTVILTAPPCPFKAVPVPTEMLPESPEVVVPELNVSQPLMPLVPAFTVSIMIEPLVDAVPDPVSIVMAPPV